MANRRVVDFVFYSNRRVSKQIDVYHFVYFVLVLYKYLSPNTWFS